MRPLALVLTISLFAGCLNAQVGTATLSGTVTDATGAIVPAAEVVLDNVDQQLIRTTVVGAEGQYVIAAIPPGSYKLTVRKAGFRETISTFPLSTGQASTLDVTLQLESSVERVEVREAPPLLQTTTATIGATVESKQITQLPLLGRNFTSLLMVLPGVSSVRSPRGGPFSVGGTGNNPNVFGQRWRNNNYTFDGVSNNEPLFNGIPMLPPPEALAEMKVESGMSSGAYGHASGANINLVSKSGSNAFHGDLWEYLRNDKLDARSFFVPSLGPLRWNQFGAAAGGPLVIPKIMSKERAWYLFGYYEGIRIRRAANTTALVPTDAQLEGDFSGSAPIYDPYTTITNAEGVRTRQPFPNNRVPSSLINSSSKLIATELYPRSNLAPGIIPGANYFNPGSSIQDGDQWSVRADHQFGARNSFFVRYSDARNPRATIGMPTLPTEGYQRLTNIAVSDTYVFSPTFLITGRFGMQRLNYGDFTGGDLTVARRAGTLDAFPAFAGFESIVPINIAGYPGISQGRAYYGPQYINSWIADASKTSGRHTLEFGGSIQRTTFKTNNQTGIQEQFTATQTSNFAPGTGFGLASFLLGTPESAGRVIGNTEGDMYGNTYSLYVQDNWRINNRLTLNLGLRYDYASPMINRYGSGTIIYETGQYVWSQTNPITGEPANTTPGVIPPDRNNFQPRIGIAYQINPATVVRTSYGIFYDTFGVNYAQTQQGNRGNWPFAFPQSVSGLNPTVPTAFIINPFPQPAQGSSTPLGCQQCLNAWHDTSRTPYVQQWTFSLQRQITQSLKAEAIYFGSHGVKISSQLIDNTALVPGPGAISSRQSLPNFPAFIMNGYNSYHSNYNGLSLILQRRFAAGMSFSVNYTWSKTINFVDELSDNIQGSGALPARVNIAQWRGVAGWDVPHRFVANYVWEIPWRVRNPLVNLAVAGWSLSGVLTFDNGLPYSAKVNADVANIGAIPGRLSQFPNIVGDPKAIDVRTPERWFNTDAFRVPAAYTFGNAGRNILRSDGLANWDFSVYKRFALQESRQFELRGEFYDFLNQTTFGYPGFVVDVPAQFGRVSSTRQSGRSIQLGLKFKF